MTELLTYYDDATGERTVTGGPALAASIDRAAPAAAVITASMSAITLSTA